MSVVTVTDPARDYLAELISKQDVKGMGVRIFVTQPHQKCRNLSCLLSA